MSGEVETITLQQRRNTRDEERLVQMLKALGNPIRFQIMQTLAARKTCITQEIVDSTPLAQSTVSQHLKVLREAGLIDGETEGPATCYCLSESGVRWLKEQIEGWLPGCCEPSLVAPLKLKLDNGNGGQGCC
jgi:ArsR family transcriptional regulator